MAKRMVLFRYDLPEGLRLLDCIPVSLQVQMLPRWWASRDRWCRLGVARGYMGRAVALGPVDLICFYC